MSWPRARFRRGPRLAAERSGVLQGASAGRRHLHRIASNERLFAGQQLIPKVRAGGAGLLTAARRRFRPFAGQAEPTGPADCGRSPILRRSSRPTAQ